MNRKQRREAERRYLKTLRARKGPPTTNPLTLALFADVERCIELLLPLYVDRIAAGGSAGVNAAMDLDDAAWKMAIANIPDVTLRAKMQQVQGAQSIEELKAMGIRFEPGAENTLRQFGEECAAMVQRHSGAALH